MLLSDLACVVTGACKGFKDASGIEFNTLYLLPVLAGSAVLTGIFSGVRHKKNIAEKEQDPSVHEGVVKYEKSLSPIDKGTRVAALQIPLGALEMGAGYFIGRGVYEAINIFS